MSPARSGRIRIAAVGFTNARPLIEGLDRDPRVELRLETPAVCADLLLAGRVDAGLVPSVTLFRDPSLRRVTAGVVAAERRVRTVLIVSERPLAEVRAVRLSAASRTSNALARIVCRALRPLDPPAFLPAVLPGAPARPDDVAEVVIGDPAFAAARASRFVLDLATAWRGLTGLPFVFACFAARPGAPVKMLDRILGEARARGLARLDAIARGCAAEVGEDVRVMREYFTRDLHYEAGARDEEAIRLFGRLLGQNVRSESA